MFKGLKKVADDVMLHQNVSRKNALRKVENNYLLKNYSLTFWDESIETTLTKKGMMKKTDEDTERIERKGERKTARKTS